MNIVRGLFNCVCVAGQQEEAQPLPEAILASSLCAKIIDIQPFERAQQSRQQFEHLIGGIPLGERHIMFIDRPKWDSVEPIPIVSPKLFDNEPGYYVAMCKVLDFIGDTLGEILDALKLCVLHDLCVDNVYKSRRMTELLQKGYGPGWGYGFDARQVPQETLDELEKEGVLYCRRDEINTPLRNVGDYLSTYRTESPEKPGRICSNFCDKNDEPQVRMIINRLFEQYYVSMERAENDDQKLAAIAKLCRAINIFHVFPDGNGRTVLWAMLPKLLMENGFCPAILDQPSKFAAGYYSIAEMVEQLKKGMANFQRAVEQFSEMGPRNNIFIFGNESI